MDPLFKMPQSLFFSPLLSQYDNEEEYQRSSSFLGEIPEGALTPLYDFSIPLTTDESISKEIIFGTYEKAIDMIESDGRSPWELPNSGATPLHALADSTFPVDQLQTLSSLLLKKGYNPTHVDPRGNDYLTLLIDRGDINILQILMFIHSAWKADPNILHPYFFNRIFIRIAESPSYSFTEQLYLLSTLLRFLDEMDSGACLNDCLNNLVHYPYTNIPIKIQLIVNLLKEINILNRFSMNSYLDAEGRNLIQLSLQDPDISPDSALALVRTLKESGCDINHASKDHLFPLLSVLKSNRPFDQKTWLANQMIHLGAKARPLLPGTNIPSFTRLFCLQKTGMERDRLAALTYLVSGRSYYQEFYYITLLCNLFGIDFQWSLDGFSLQIAGLDKEETQIAAWMEREAWEFYSALLNDDNPCHYLFWKRIYEKLGNDLSEALWRVNGEQIREALSKVRSSLATAFAMGRNRRASRESRNHPDTISLIATLSTGGGQYHDIGILFKKGIVYFSNKGFGTRDAGVSAHPFTTRRFELLVNDIEQERCILDIVHNYFPERALDAVRTMPLLFSQKMQRANNCPIASYASLELAVVYSSLIDFFPATSAAARAIARAIKDVHHSTRKESALAQYFSYHSIPRDVPMSRELLLLIDQKTAHSSPSFL